VPHKNPDITGIQAVSPAHFAKADQALPHFATNGLRVITFTNFVSELTGRPFAGLSIGLMRSQFLWHSSCKRIRGVAFATRQNQPLKYL
jgi:hypothetical protein